MANKRDLKKQVKYICGDLATECMLAAEYVKGVVPAEMHKIVAEIASLQTSALASATFGFDKTEAEFESKAAYNKARTSYNKKAFAALREKFNNKVQDIVKQMNAALPQAVKDANKAAK